MGNSRQPSQRCWLVQITAQGNRPEDPDNSVVRGVAYQRKDPESPREPRQCALGHITAADNQQSSHLEIIARHAFESVSTTMTVQVTIKPSGHSYRADPERSILQTAIDAGFILPYGCRNGACGSCKGKVLAGDVDYGDYQEKVLTAEAVSYTHLTLPTAI